MASLPKHSPEPDNGGKQPDPAAAEDRNAAAVLTPPPRDPASSDAAQASDAPTLIDQPFDSPTLVDPGLKSPGSGSDAPTQIDLGAPSASRAGAPVAGGQPVLPPGTILANRYEITKLLGEGGMGAVYKANDRELNRPVALKVIRPDLARNQSIVDRFKQELLLAREVTHKNVIRIYDLGESEGLRFITMEFVEGEDLRSLLLDRKKLPPDEAVNIMQQVCRALDAAHTVGVIHRDLKPQNIMRDQTGRILVMDFGLARTLEGDGMTQTGALVGTMDYMSPEQALGKELDQRSDLFAIGLIFYELLTGKMPYRADSAIASMLKRTQERAAPVVTHDPNIPPALSDIVSKCLDPDLKLRYQRTGEVLADLEAWQGGRAAATLKFPASQQPWGQTIPWHWIGGAAAVVVLAAVGFMLRGKISSPKETPATGPVISLAVLPFKNASGDPSINWLGGTLAEMLRTDIGESAAGSTVESGRVNRVLQALWIDSDTSIEPNTIRQVADFTTSDRIIWGQYIKLGDQIRIDATLRDLKQQRNFPLKADAANEKELPKALQQLAESVQKVLSLPSETVKELQAKSLKPSSQSVPALRYYNEGVQSLRLAKFADAQKSFQAATQQDRNFALAFAKLGQAYADQGYANEAEQATRKAVEDRKSTRLN